MLIGEFAVGEVFLSMLWFFLFLIWIYLLIAVFRDIFRSYDLSGWAKALWMIFVVVLPYLGVFVYLVARGGEMGRRGTRAEERAAHVVDEGLRSAAGGSGPSVASELALLAKLHDQGTITEEEFAALKTKALAAA